MDAALITAITAAFVAVGGGAWKVIDRADKKRERREIKVEELLKSRVAALEAEKKDAEAAAKADRRYASRVKAAAGSWREQLIANKITPDPADWPKEEDAHE
ncbi:hypothetical protein [Arthrobacter sp. ISL-72]|uniref:hypothetical protein n=1 Tax=Arthrobacter sp. ISL-72 TaxID=2819114 RepID=UPI001BE55533|nr:hypothetical protein [Arthrobacter sp. ISL-72]MBT2594725.1 hypothetical protein [Arthrobacter sp. ISL-72]